MEDLHGHVGHEFVKDTSAYPLPLGYRRTFFRGNKSVDDLFEEFAKKKDTFIPAWNDAVVFDPDFDVGAGCEESCEVFSDEDNGETGT
jgi:hypothetical protein